VQDLVDRESPGGLEVRALRVGDGQQRYLHHLVVWDREQFRPGSRSMSRLCSARHRASHSRNMTLRGYRPRTCAGSQRLNRERSPRCTARRSSATAHKPSEISTPSCATCSDHQRETAHQARPVTLAAKRVRVVAGDQSGTALGSRPPQLLLPPKTSAGREKVGRDRR
jgi:hypothetical protein